MQDILMVNELYTLADLSQENSATAFGQHEIVVYHPLK